MIKVKINLLFVALLLIQNILLSQDKSYHILQLKEDFKNINVEELNIISNFQEINSQQKKNTGMAILYSLLLPGMGELYAEGFNSGIYFTVADGVLWGTLLGMNVYGNWQADRYKSYAVVHAGINPDGKDKDFFATISAYSSIDNYNNEKAFERNFKSMLDKQKFYWNWNSNENRKTYRSMWTSSEQTFNNIRFVVGGLILNRVVSIINAVRLTSRYNKGLKENEVSLNFYLIKNQLDENELTINFQKRF